MKPKPLTILIAALALWLLPAARAQKPKADDMKMGGLKTHIGQRAVAVAVELVIEAGTSVNELNALWKKQSQAYSATISAWYGA